ncbi:hypothetical protein [Thioalkalivibrio sp. HK1]|uniref:hypothetical protein n=1 Tax=Thioalkalivibrio sp. HK1 TaxID=1469245 RepID=UPI0004BC6DB1|nr:hypothetical protein [Thioalkalivibrio sp. HK1]
MSEPCTPSAATTGDRPFARSFLARSFAAHFWLWLSIGGGLFLGDVLLDSLRWSPFWPVSGWGLILGVHFLFLRAGKVDDEWVQERSDDLKLRSYDLGHIVDIEDRVRQGDHSTSPIAERTGSK